MKSSNYPDDWDVRRRHAYERDEWRCSNCGRLGGQYGDRELHAHHIVPKSKGGSDKMSNLKTLCKECHNAIHHNGKMAPTVTQQSVDGGNILRSIAVIGYVLVVYWISSHLTAFLNDGSLLGQTAHFGVAAVLMAILSVGSVRLARALSSRKGKQKVVMGVAVLAVTLLTLGYLAGQFQLVLTYLLMVGGAIWGVVVAVTYVVRMIGGEIRSVTSATRSVRQFWR
ncbi:HNH endonuclease [Haladaptatus sp. NG-SE-30]